MADNRTVAQRIAERYVEICRRQAMLAKIIMADRQVQELHPERYTKERQELDERHAQLQQVFKEEREKRGL